MAKGAIMATRARSPLVARAGAGANAGLEARRHEIRGARLGELVLEQRGGRVARSATALGIRRVVGPRLDGGACTGRSSSRDRGGGSRDSCRETRQPPRRPSAHRPSWTKQGRWGCAGRRRGCGRTTSRRRTSRTSCPSRWTRGRRQTRAGSGARRARAWQWRGRAVLCEKSR